MALVTRADFIAAVAARSTGVNTYLAGPYVPNPANPNLPVRPDGMTIYKNGAAMYSLIYPLSTMGGNIAATDANPTGMCVTVWSSGDAKCSCSATDFLNTLT